MTPTTCSRLFVLCLTVGLLTLTGCAATVPSAAKPLPADVRVLQSQPDRLLVELPNRLLVVVQEVHTAPVASAQVWVKTGSIYEQEHVGAGLSHFLEHLLSGGSTSTRSEQESNRMLGQIGAQTNASTGVESVNYYINTTSPFAPQAIELLSDWMQHALITQTEYERERDVIQREFDMGQGEPGRIFWKLSQQARYRFHPARHPTIGYLDEFKRISRDEIYNFYKRMYVPNNMVFVVAGDVDKQKVVDQIVGLWKDAESRPLPALSLPVEPPSDQPRDSQGVADVRKPRLRLAWPGTRMGDDGDYALDLLSEILGQGESSRLVRSVRDGQRRVSTISAYNMSFYWGQGFFGIDSEVVTENKPGEPAGVEAAIDEAKKAILADVAKVVGDGVTPQELARAKRQTVAQVIYSAQTAQGLAGRLAGDLIATGDPDYLARYSQAIEAITAQQVQAAAAKFLLPNRLITVILRPSSAEQPIQALARPADEPGGEKAAREEVKLDNTALVEQFQRIANRGAAREGAAQVQPIQRFVLPNGLRLLVCRNTSIPAVAMQFYQLGGLLADTPGQEGLANATARMMMRGTKSRSAQQVAAEVEDLGADLSVECGNNTLYSRAVCLKQDWPKVLALQADVLLNPAFPTDEWGKLQPRLLASIDRQQDNWSSELRMHFLDAYFGQHPWSRTPVGRREVVSKLTPDDLGRFHREHLGASEAVLAIFGDVQPEEVVKRATELFAALPAKPAVPFVALKPEDPAPRLIQVKTNKPLAAVQIGLGPGITRQSPDYAAMAVLDRVLSSFPTGWLDEALRGEGPGLVYAVGAGQMTGVVPGYFAVLFNCQPAKVPEALARARTQVERTKTELVQPQDLARAKAAVLTDEFLGKQSNADRAADAALNELYGMGLDEPREFQQAVEQLTAQKLRSAAQAHLRNAVTVVLTHEPLPEKELESGGAATQPK